MWTRDKAISKKEKEKNCQPILQQRIPVLFLSLARETKVAVLLSGRRLNSCHDPLADDSSPPNNPQLMDGAHTTVSRTRT
ncbi:hypothetical protein CEXT_230351 [Caerostris extrusa]|uniref:Uncharacterized protein n=1 Tax=Caerostris extrusa TaxID=172846 RepID=A0AAV4U9P2_CAEEX|nr:hypothetical protein CEXT_230351 [Caerostris extrusa]